MASLPTTSKPVTGMLTDLSAIVMPKTYLGNAMAYQYVSGGVGGGDVFFFDILSG